MKVSNIINSEKTLNNLAKKIDNNQSFKNILNSEILKTEKLKVSKHASQRLNSRNINLTNEQMERVADGITLAKEKGLKDTLILIDNIALVVNIKEKLIITAINKDKKQTFTNIDGAVIL